MSQVIVFPSAGVGPMPIATGFGEDAKTITLRFVEALDHYWQLPVSRRSASIPERFYELLSEWKAECSFTSSVTKLVMHPAYQHIIGLGSEAVPLILRELEKSPDNWFWALNAITGADPVSPSDRGRIKKMADAWIQWGKEQGIRW
jgi:hypothetical protein